MKTLIITPSIDTYSETFIQDTIRFFPEPVDVLHGLSTPTPCFNGIPFSIRPSLWSKFFYRCRTLSRRKARQECRKSYFRRIFSKSRPEVIFVEFGTTAAMLVDVLESGSIPYVVRFHGCDASVHDIWEQWGAEYRRIFRSAAAIIAVSRHMKDRLVREGAEESKICYIPCGCDAYPAPDDSLRIPEHFLAVGRFMEKKAPVLTLLAFAKVHEKWPSATLTMVGNGPLLATCQKIVKNQGLEGAVSLPGPLPHEAVLREMWRASCFVQHSVEAANGDCEGTPVAVCEAMRAGRPIVTTRHAGIRDIVEHEKSGFLVDEFDVAGMVRWMDYVLSYPEKAVLVGREARRFATENLTREKNMSAIVETLRKAATGGS